MENKRVILYAAFLFVSYLLFNAWKEEHPPLPSQTINHSITAPSVLPVNQNAENLPSFSESQKKQASQNIQVKTDVLSLIIDGKTGNITQVSLLKYPESIQHENIPVKLLYDTPVSQYVADSNLLVTEDDGVKGLNITYHSEKTHYFLEENQNTLEVTLEGKTDNGLFVKKILTLDRKSYLVRVRYELINQGTLPFQGYINLSLVQNEPKQDESSLFHVGSYTGASYASPGKSRYQKVSFKEMRKKNLEETATGGWIAMQEHYFLSAWIPNAKTKQLIYTRSQDARFTIGLVSPKITLQPKQSYDETSSLYVGPEDVSVLKNIADGLDLTVDYGWFWFLSSALFAVMKVIEAFVGNWGLAIILVTLLIKLAFYKLSASSYKSMAGMRKLQPQLQLLRERYGDDRTALSQATMELYRKEKVNPLGGCLPVLIQIPVFIALYWVLLESVELRQAPFIFWIKDLSNADPYHVLPIIMGATMWIQQRLNPAPPDPTQAKVMMFLPLLFTAIFWNFPSGLVLYWIVNNLLSILQQWHITRKYGNVTQNANSKTPVKLVK